MRAMSSEATWLDEYVGWGRLTLVGVMLTPRPSAPAAIAPFQHLSYAAWRRCWSSRSSGAVVHDDEAAHIDLQRVSPCRPMAATSAARHAQIGATALVSRPAARPVSFFVRAMNATPPLLPESKTLTPRIELKTGTHRK